MINDNNFTFLFNEQFEKIPFLFRFSKRRYIVSLIVMGVFIVAGLVFWNFFDDSGKYTVISSVDNAHVLAFNDYNYTFLFLMIFCFAGVVVIAAWMSLAKVFERRAYKKAANLSNMIFLTERHKQAVEWSNWKMQNRDY